MAGKKSISKGKKKDIKLIERKKLSANDKIKELEEDIAKTKYNKKTQHAIGLMKAKLAMMKKRATERSSSKGGGDDSFTVRKTGDGTVVLLGFPSVGKSTLLNKLTGAKSDIGAYAFTTLSPVPGVLNYKHAQIQIIDVPGIVHGAASGRGRGKEVMGVLRSADMILILIDALNPEHYEAILAEVYETGVRINSKKPDVKITKKSKGGINVGTTVKLTKIDAETIKQICREMKITNADILIRTDISTEQLIDIIEGNKKYAKSIVVLNKIDLVDKDTLEKIKEKIKPDIMISGETGEGIGDLKKLIFDKMEFIRIYLKEVNKKADMKEPLIMFEGCTIEDVCNKLHRDFVKKFKFARLWGKGAKFDGQVFRKLDKELLDSDILEIHTR